MASSSADGASTGGGFLRFPGFGRRLAAPGWGGGRPKASASAGPGRPAPRFFLWPPALRFGGAGSPRSASAHSSAATRLIVVGLRPCFDCNFPTLN